MDIDPSSIESKLYQKFGVQKPSESPKEIIQKLCAFWHHFALHKRKCDYSDKDIISVFDAKCPYPVWHREEWIKHADPLAADFDPQQAFFTQLWELFQHCPIPHNVGAGNENCEYTDDWWYSRNCYLSHSGLKNENVYYCFRIIKHKDCQFCVFSSDLELCTDLINCNSCFKTTYALNCRQCSDSASLFDCRNCSDCLFCWNLRNKKYCLFNEQLTKEEFEREKAKYDFSSRNNYEAAKAKFLELLRTKAWWKNLNIEQSENSSGDILDKCKNCQNCFFVSESEDCFNTIRGAWNKDNLHSVSNLKSELVYMTAMAQDQCYDIRYCYNVIQSKYLEYCAHCFNCQNCFACCGLTNKKYHILNKEYSPEEYEKKVAEIKDKLKTDAIYGQFFPPHFAACPYEESLAGFHWPLSPEQIKAKGFRAKEYREEKLPNHSSPSGIPDRAADADPEICQKVFWDETVLRPFQITEFDLKYAQNNHVPLPNQYYIRRLKENFSFIFFDGELRQTTCAVTGKTIETALPKELDDRILSLEVYRERVE